MRPGQALHSWDEREVPYDLLVTVPVHGGPGYVARSAGLGDDLGFVPTDPYTLQSKAAPNIFVIGDASNVPTSKAGSVTHFEGETVVENIGRSWTAMELDRPLTTATPTASSRPAFTRRC